MAWAPDYIDADDLKSFVRISDTADDVQIGYAIAAASRAIDEATNRQFGNTTIEPRYYTARYDRRRGRWVVEVDDIMTAAGLVVTFDSADDGTYTAEIDEFQLQPANAEANGRPWEQLVVRPSSSALPTTLEDGVEVTAQFGWTAIPTTIVEATLLQASRFLARREAPFGVAGSPDIGSEMRLLARVDPDVAVTVSPYRRWWGAA